MTIPIKGSDYYYSAQQQSIDRRTKRFVIERCAPFVSGPAVLDLGYVDGDWTDLVLSRHGSSDIVEGREDHVRRARERYSCRADVRIFHARFEEFAPDRTYNTIIAGDMLRYVHEPSAYLRKLSGWLVSPGRLIVTVPNSRSLHRRVGTLMGMEAHPVAASSRDIEVGNLKSYDRYDLRREIIAAGLRILELRGCFLKPLSSAQMMDWNDDLLRAFLEVGDELEDYAWFLYAICCRSDG
jgi:trans-aconitate methyltransferase